MPTEVDLREETPQRWQIRQVADGAPDGGTPSLVLAPDVVHGLARDRDPAACFTGDRDHAFRVRLSSPDLQAGLSEVARVLKPGGSAVIYTVFATPRLEPREAAAVNRPLGNVPQNLERAWVEEAFREAGFRVERLEEIGTEFREYDEERTQPASESLPRLARLRRRREEVIQRFGKDRYSVWEASLHWLAYLLMGKLEPVAYVLRRP
jgi:SAM-dependent methyltransferase